MYSVYRNSVLNKHFSMENVVYSDFIIIIDIHNITCTCHVHVMYMYLPLHPLQASK